MKRAFACLALELLVDSRPFEWCPGRELNPHTPFGITDFKSVASADFATRASEHGLGKPTAVKTVSP